MWPLGRMWPSYKYNTKLTYCIFFTFIGFHPCIKLSKLKNSCATLVKKLPDLCCLETEEQKGRLDSLSIHPVSFYFYKHSQKLTFIIFLIF